MTTFVPPPPSNVVSLRRLTLAPDLIVSAEEIAGKSMGVLGTTGSGKSTTARTLVEQLLITKVPFTIADIENEYAAIKELGEVILAGPESDFGRIQLDVKLTNEKEAYALGRRAYLHGLSVVLLLGELDDDVRKLFLRAYCTAMFEAASNPDTRMMHKLVLEEAHEYVPQTGLSKEDPLRLTLLRLAKRGRKRGIDLVVISQRPANVDKDVLTQCQIFLAHYVTYATDIATYKTVFKADDLETRLSAMKAGDVLFQFGKRQQWTHITPPKTSSPSETPGAVHVENFVEVRGKEAIQEEIRQHGDDEGTSVVKTAYLRDLEHRVPQAEADLKVALEKQAVLEARIGELEAIVPTGGTDEDLRAQVINLRIALREATARADRAEAAALPITLLMDVLEQRRKETQK